MTKFIQLNDDESSLIDANKVSFIQKLPYRSTGNSTVRRTLVLVVDSIRLDLTYTSRNDSTDDSTKRIDSDAAALKSVR